MELENTAEKSKDLLKDLLQFLSLHSRDGDAISNGRDGFVLIYARQIHELTEDVLNLEDQKRTHATPLLVRGMLESLFILGAATHEISFAGEKVVFDIEQTAKYAGRDAKKATSQTLKDYLHSQISQCEEIARDLRERLQIKHKLSWSPVDCAEKSGLFRQYAIDYAIYSAATHGELFSVILAQNQRSSVHIFRTITFACLEAVRFVLSVFHLDVTNRFEDRRKALLAELLKLERDGKLKQLYAAGLSGQPTIVRNRKTGGLQKN